jgi:CHAT domain-containing protein
VTGEYEKAKPLVMEKAEWAIEKINRFSYFLSNDELEEMYYEYADAAEDIMEVNLNSTISDSELKEAAINSIYATRAYLLGKVIEFRRKINLSNDSTIKKLQNEIIECQTSINRLANNDLVGNKIAIDSLENSISLMDKKIHWLLKEDTLTNLTAYSDWKKIRDTLREDEAVVEFYDYSENRYHLNVLRSTKDQIFLFDSGTIIQDKHPYVALVIRRNPGYSSKYISDSVEYPLIIPLFEQDQLDSLLAKCESLSDEVFVSDLYNRGVEVLQSSFQGYGNELFELVWKPIDSCLNGISTIYFSPSGTLNQISFAALPIDDDQLLMNKYNLVQLSTTKDLAGYKNDDFRYSSDYYAVLYGDIAYYSDTTEMKHKASSYLRSEGISNRFQVSLHDTLSAFSQLPGTLAEVRGISPYLGKNFIINAGSLASEESFKMLSGNNSPDIIHIATHGFFFSDPSDETRKRIDWMLSGQQQFTLAEDPLQRSGLVFAGANHYWMGENLPVGVEDGLVTAKEVSAMNLTNTKLVVMSACETGLGDIRGSEGVFGLQRGFKMAGVKTLIMSLWKVPDAETAEFMQTFYTEWSSGKPMRQAFLDTQRLMKSKYPNEPYKWAAFVMVE